MNKAFGVLAALFSALLFGCTDSMSSGSSSRVLSASRIAKLTETASRLAESEMARMSAAEMIYRNKVQYNETILPVLQTKTGAYLKIYRNFTGYEVEDIVLSDSVLYPITYEIRYDYDVLASTQRGMDLPNAFSLSSQDREFELLRHSSVTQRYRCDWSGDYEGAPSSLLSRPNPFFLSEKLESDSATPSPSSIMVMSPPPSGLTFESSPSSGASRLPLP